MEGEENIFRAVKLNARTLTRAKKEDAPSVSKTCHGLSMVL